MNIIWFKKDLRVQDHQALYRAVQDGPSIALFIFEPDWLNSPQFHANHLQFAFESLIELEGSLSKIGIPLIYKFGDSISVFNDLHQHYKIKKVFSHQETGLDWTFKRDQKMSQFFNANSILWNQFKQFGVIRKLKDRNTWNEKRVQIIERPLVPIIRQNNVSSPWNSEALPVHLIENKALKKLIQKGGSQQAQLLIDSFFAGRGLNYFRSLSSPNSAFEACSRLSPYIAWGNISITQIHHAIRNKRQQLGLMPLAERKLWSLTLNQFESRIWWHCHFIQKLESEPQIEFRNFNRHFDGLRENDFDQNKFEAWCKGETGYPLVDACMRALLQHGWINFRMRAMLMSFASYQLWLHWKKPAEFLAQHFIDFEPGIHYSQVQMQSGVTGINSVRIYSPQKQIEDQDPQGLFIKKYVPELSNVPLSDLAQPHLMPPLLKIDLGFKDGYNYPHPIVDAESSYKLAKEKIFLWKKNPDLIKESENVLNKHGSRAHKNFPAQKRN